MDRHIENDPINYKKGYQVSLNEQEISKKGRYSSDMEENKDSTNANKTDEKANKEQPNNKTISKKEQVKVKIAASK